MILIVLIGIALNINFSQGSVITSYSGTTYPFWLVDDYGRNITFMEEPQRIISISPSSTEVIFAVGAGNKVVAVDANSDYPSEVDQLPKIENYPTLDIEAIITYNPDLVFGAGITSYDDVANLEQQGISVFILAPFNVKEVLSSVEDVGIITNHHSEALNIIDSLQTRINVINGTVSEFKNKPKIFIEYFSYPLYTFGKGTYGHDIIELAGGINIAENATGLYPQVDDEFVITQNPDIIFYSKGPWTTTDLTTISNRTGWKSIKAVKNEHIYPIEEDWTSRGTPRIVDAVEEMHSKILDVIPELNPTRIAFTSIDIHFLLLFVPVVIPIVIYLRKNLKRGQ